MDAIRRNERRGYPHVLTGFWVKARCRRRLHWLTQLLRALELIRLETGAVLGLIEAARS